MNKNNLKKHDFGEYHPLICMGKAVARIKGDKNLCIVKKSDDSYQVLADDVKEIKEISEDGTIIFKNKNNEFCLLLDDKVVSMANFNNVRCSGKIRPVGGAETFILQDKDEQKEYFALVLSDGPVMPISKKYQSIKPFDKLGYSIVKDGEDGFANKYAINKSLSQASISFSDISEPSDAGLYTVRLVTGQTGIIATKVMNPKQTKDLCLVRSDISKVFLCDDQGKVKAPGEIIPVQDENGRVGLISGVTPGCTNLSNFVTGISITEPNEHDVVELKRLTRNGIISEDIALMVDKSGKFSISEDNKVNDKYLYGEVLELINKTNGDGLYILDRKYFLDKHSLSDIKVALKNYLCSLENELYRVIAGHKMPEELEQLEKMKVEEMIRNHTKKLKDLFQDCLIAKIGNPNLTKSGNGVILDELTIDEIDDEIWTGDN